MISSVIPAEAGTHEHRQVQVCFGSRSWVPAFAGMTSVALGVLS